MKNKRKENFRLLLPLGTRVLVIANLSLLFFIISAKLLTPFSVNYLTMNQHMGLVRTIIGEGRGELTPEIQAKLERNRQRFAQLSSEERKGVEESYQKIIEGDQITFEKQFMQGVSDLAFDTALYFQAWLLLSLALGIFALLRIEGTAAINWSLPLLAALLLLQAFYNLRDNPEDPWVNFFPSEQELMGEHKSYSRDRLEEAWKIFLIENYTEESPAQDLQSRSQQVEDGEFAFNLALLQHIETHSGKSNDFALIPPIISQVLLLAWSFFYALFLSREEAWRLCEQ